MPLPAALVRLAYADAWQAEGRLREPYGGGVLDLPGVRLMASGLPQEKWNSGDVTDPDLVDLDAVRAWYAERAVLWGLRLPAGVAWPHGRHVLSQRLMGLTAGALRPAPLPARVLVRDAGPADLDAVAHVDATAFGDPPGPGSDWLRPQLGAPGCTVVLAKLGGEPVAVATAVATDASAGPSVAVFGVGVLPRARRRGIAAGLTCHLLKRAFGAGVTMACLVPETDDAARLYARLGFAGTEGIDIYVDC